MVCAAELYVKGSDTLLNFTVSGPVGKFWPTMVKVVPLRVARRLCGVSACTDVIVNKNASQIMMVRRALHGCRAGTVVVFDLKWGKAPGCGLDSVFIFVINCFIIVVFGIELGLWPMGPIVLFPDNGEIDGKIRPLFFRIC